ncbi:hypothetical protein WMY93_016807 [Mugilogobius chulae]|uniref:USP domain-containing protein n=1 Tax=Mugilogobius chulae TaxID=88201 RepID=A0AAW0NLD4_9GOBI
MFGNLFEEEDEEGSSSISSMGRVLKGPEEPLHPEEEAICAASRTKEAPATSTLCCRRCCSPQSSEVRVIPLQLQRLFARLLLVDQQSASTADSLTVLAGNTTEGTNQHDVQELNRILFSALEHSLVGTRGSSFINSLYHGTIVNSIVCKECGNEDFLDLTACVCGVSSLEEALWNMFVEEELFEGNNLYRCAQCNKLVTAAKSAKMRKLPLFMTMSLLSFPLIINLRPFCEQAEGEDSDYCYELFSVIIHKGGCYGGHYHVYIRDIDQLGRWEPPEDDSKSKTKKKATQVKLCESKPQMDDPLSILTAIIAQAEPTGPEQSTDSGEVSADTQATGDQEVEAQSQGSHWFDLNDSTVTSIRESDIEKQFQAKRAPTCCSTGKHSCAGLQRVNT